MSGWLDCLLHLVQKTFSIFVIYLLVGKHIFFFFCYCFCCWKYVFHSFFFSLQNERENLWSNKFIVQYEFKCIQFSSSVECMHLCACVFALGTEIFQIFEVWSVNKFQWRTSISMTLHVIHFFSFLPLSLSLVYLSLLPLFPLVA